MIIHWILALAQILVAVALSRNKLLFYSPGGLFFSFWAVMCIVPLLLIWDVYVSYHGHLYIIVISLMGLLISGLCSKHPPRQSARPYPIIPPEKLVYTLATLALLLILYDLSINGVTLDTVLVNPFKAAGQYATNRYAESLNKTVTSAFIYPFIYTSVTFLGFLLAVRRVSRGGILFTFLPTLMIMGLQSSKGGFMLSCIFCYAGYSYNRRGTSKGSILSFLLKPKNFWRTSLGVFLVFAMIVYSFYTRGLSDADSNYAVHKITSYMVSYSSGHFFAFSDWFSYYIGENHYTNYFSYPDYNGALNFFAIAKIFSDVELYKGVFIETLEEGRLLKTNIYTQFRGVIQDFGFAGSFVFWAIWFYVFSLAYRVVTMSRTNVVAPIYILYVCAIYQTYIISIFNYLSIFGTIFLIYGYLVVFRRIQRPRAILSKTYT